MEKERTSTGIRPRRLLWAAFWFVFLTTPVVAAVIRAGVQRLSMDSLWNSIAVMAIPGTIGGGALLAGFLVARLKNRDPLQLFFRSVSFGILFAMFHLIVAFILFRIVDAAVMQSRTMK